jgi:hypothetical protein
VLWIALLIIAIAVLGIGTVLEVALWALLITAAVIVVGGFLITRALRGGARRRAV